jgi:AraC-like DNA-binding protein
MLDESHGLTADPAIDWLAGIRLFQLVRLTGALPRSAADARHVLFLPTATGGRLTAAGKPLPLATGEMVLLVEPQRGALHWQAASGILLAIADAPMRAAAEALAAEALAANGTLPPGGILRTRDPLLAQLLHGLAEAAMRGDRFGVARLLAHALLARAADVLLARQPSPGPDAGGLAPWRLRRVEAFAGANLGRTIRLAELASVAGLSVFHFSRAFKQSTGHAPQAWLMRKRLARAQELLADGSLPLIEAAFEAGFCSHAHLTATFRRFLGVTPSAWRAQALDSAATRAPAGLPPGTGHSA